MTPRTVAYCIRVHCLHLLCIAKVMTCSCPRGRTTDQLAAYTRSRQLSHFAAPRKPARVHARPLQPSTASNHSRVQRLSTRSTTSPSASAARADAPADAPATPEQPQLAVHGRVPDRAQLSHPSKRGAATLCGAAAALQPPSGRRPHSAQGTQRNAVSAVPRAPQGAAPGSRGLQHHGWHLHRKNARAKQCA